MIQHFALDRLDRDELSIAVCQASKDLKDTLKNFIQLAKGAKGGEIRILRIHRKVDDCRNYRRSECLKAIDLHHASRISASSQEYSFAMSSLSCIPFHSGTNFAISALLNFVRDKSTLALPSTFPWARHSQKECF